jgi:plasmid stabilization system protein ParE
MASVLITAKAKRDLLQIWTLLAERSEIEMADQVLREIESTCELLSRNPNIGRIRQEFSIPLRSFSVKHRNYLIFYNPIVTGIQVYRVLDGRMDLSRIL